MLNQQKAEAQQVLDDLFTEHVLHFKLSASAIEPIGGEEYIVRFNDSRLRSVDVSWSEGENFKDVFRTAVFERLGRMRGNSKGNTHDYIGT